MILLRGARHFEFSAAPDQERFSLHEVLRHAISGPVSCLENFWMSCGFFQKRPGAGAANAGKIVMPCLILAGAGLRAGVMSGWR